MRNGEIVSQSAGMGRQTDAKGAIRFNDYRIGLVLIKKINVGKSAVILLYEFRKVKPVPETGMLALPLRKFGNFRSGGAGRHGLAAHIRTGHNFPPTKACLTGGRKSAGQVCPELGWLPSIPLSCQSNYPEQERMPARFGCFSPKLRAKLHGRTARLWRNRGDPVFPDACSAYRSGFSRSRFQVIRDLLSGPRRGRAGLRGDRYAAGDIPTLRRRFCCSDTLRASQRPCQGAGVPGRSPYRSAMEAAARLDRIGGPKLRTHVHALPERRQSVADHCGLREVTDLVSTAA